jgi:hypothetical protein
MDHSHAGVQHDETAFYVYAERGRRVPATLDTDLAQLGGEALRGLRSGTSYKDCSAGLLVGARDALQRGALAGPCLTDDDDESLRGTRDPDGSLLLAGKLTAARRNANC